MSHDNDNARNFAAAAAAACGTAAITPLISTWPISATHIWLDEFSILGRLLYQVEFSLASAFWTHCPGLPEQLLQTPPTLYNLLTMFKKRSESS